MTDTSGDRPAPLPRVWTLWGGPGPVDVELTAADEDAVRDVLPALGAALGRPVDGLWHGTTRVPADRRLTAPELGHGAVLGWAGPMTGADTARSSSALELHVVGGPAAGLTFPLGQGRHVIGRGGDASIRLDDPDVSRTHVTVQVGGGAITVADLGSTNGSRLEDSDLGIRPASWPPGAVLRLGASAMTVTGPCGTSAALAPAPGGRLRLRPTPRLLPPAPTVEVVFPRPPAAAPRRRLAWVAIALPAVGGMLMAWLLHAPTFLFFALLSPVVALGTWLSERWSGRRSGRRDAAAHARELAAAEARVADAVAADLRVSTAAHPDPATVTTAARRHSPVLWSRGGGPGSELPVRLGDGPGDTRVTRIDVDGARARETAAHVPVVVDLATGGGLAVTGPRERALGVLATVVGQLVTLYPPGDVDLLLLTDPRRLPDWAWARWLPHLHQHAVHVRAGTAAEQDESLHGWLTALIGRRRAAGTALVGRLVVLVDRPLDPRIAATLRAGRDVGILTLVAADVAENLPVAVDTRLRLGGETGDQAVLSRNGAADHPAVTVDRLPREVAAALARDLARLLPTGTATELPRSVRLLDLPPVGLRLGDDDGLTGVWSTARDRLVATLGRTAQGPVQVDLCRQGPHSLVAGTTGSGKSELLQTLIAGLALNHPPERCSFLLVDYKGGAAFAEAATLPHTVGLVTDLDGQTTQRALRSLTAELTRREEILAAHRAADIAALPDEVVLARLVIVVDEFAGLAEELPAFVPGLVGIAQRGRSLGVHLVLATQRPSGVVSPEIRANCTMRICLRTTDEADSRDVLGTPEAAHLPVDLPGRAFLRSGSGPTTALQVARVATSPSRGPGTGPVARRWVWPPVQTPAVPSNGPEDPSDLARLCAGLAGHAALTGSPLPHRPWRPPLPDRVLASELEGARHPGARGAARLSVGLVDRPDDQAQQILEIDLTEGGTWLAVGGARSGRSTLLRTVLGEAVHRLGPDELHVHVLEAGGGSLATATASLPHAGTTVSGEDALRTVRLVERLAQEVAARRAAADPAGWPLLLLLVDGVEAVTTLLDESDPGRGSANLMRLLRDGAGAGLTCVVTADRAIPGGRLAASARQRLVLPLPDRADYAVAGIASRAVPAHRPPGRALLGEEGLECQVAAPRPLDVARGRGPACPPPLRIAVLPPDPVLSAPRTTTADDRSLRLPIGPGGDDGSALVVDLLRTGGLLVSGPPGSGRSTALHAFAQHLSSLGAAVLHVGRPPSPRTEGTAADPHGTVWLDAADEAGVADWLAGRAGRPGVVIADDVGAPAEFPVLARLPAPGAGSGIVLLAAAGPGSFSAHYQGPLAALRRGRSGLLLCPGPGDADLLGVRLPRTPLPVRPGSGWLVSATAIERVQVARRLWAPLDATLLTESAGADVSVRAVTPAQRQRRSSTGPISWRAYQASS